MSHINLINKFLCTEGGANLAASLVGSHDGRFACGHSRDGHRGLTGDLSSDDRADRADRADRRVGGGRGSSDLDLDLDLATLLLGGGGHCGLLSKNCEQRKELIGAMVR